ncbi:tRNA (adenosine(37)-N6)-threonylcarbamoyltransferase complex ATPase subunit type 1 TsaE [Marinospirillum sp. MEB164]|uniref:tRNA threonylcarbamoyladenosine biosynthesis protein TsaE n=1 Tax=Marinospirillum alkalitolerans TaxID=3123374 RepID=A0ABW8PUT9_9GAMM
MKKSYFLADEAAQLALGAQLANVLHQGVVFLEGDLGAGKTTLVRGIIQALGHQGAVKSPTYTLVEPYLLAERQVYHFDLYRLADPEELEYIGIRDYLQQEALCLIEWPQKGQGFLPQPDVLLTLHVQSSGRLLEIQALTESGRSVLTHLMDTESSFL